MWNLHSTNRLREVGERELPNSAVVRMGRICPLQSRSEMCVVVAPLDFPTY